MSTLLQDLRYAVRTLGRAPGFTLVALVTLALGIGANTAIFSIVNAVLLRPLPYHEPDRSSLCGVTGPTGRRRGCREPELADYRPQAQSLEHVAAFSSTSFNLTGGAGSEPLRVLAAQVQAPMFRRARRAAARSDACSRPTKIGRARARRRCSRRAVAIAGSAGPSIVGRTIELDAAAYHRRRHAAGVAAAAAGLCDRASRRSGCRSRSGRWIRSERGNHGLQRARRG